MQRRHLLLGAAELGALVIATPLPLGAVVRACVGSTRKPTPYDELGPFYRRLAPDRSALRMPGDPGLPLALGGTVYSENGAALPGATVEIWQTNGAGRYDTSGNRYRAAIKSGSAGGYAVETVVPGHYPGRVCQHVHYLVRAEGHKPLVTQLYFATDPVFDGDPDKNFTRDPVCTSRDLVRPVVITGEPSNILAHVKFDLVLETA